MFGCNMSYTHGNDVLYRVRVFVCEIGKRITPDQFALEYMLASFDTLGGDFYTTFTLHVCEC